jgi:thiol-disulfide isomerase/thioredoxin
MNNNKNMIPGIYNYCDSWCEHCKFTQQCANYIHIEKTNHDTSFESIGEILASTIEMLHELAKKHGIDLDSIDYDACEEEKQKVRKAAGDFKSSILSKAYIDLSTTWLNSSESILINKIEELRQFEEHGIRNIDFAKELHNLNEAVEVINWYNFLIHVKTMRASTGTISDGDSDDNNGSAKVALIGIDRSIVAWATLLKIFSEQEDKLLDILVHLERLRRQTENDFPNARAFKRPGLDE